MMLDVENKYKPKIYTEVKSVGSLEIKFEGEQYSGHPVLDTKVSINGHDIKEAIEKYFI